MPQVTVVIAAHNEATVIERGLTALLADAEPDEIGVLVVSNGSTDNTSDVARRAGVALGHLVEAIDIEQASKIAALRAADELLAQRPAVPRIYLDADVLLTTQVARQLARALADDAPRMSLARIKIETSHCSWLVRQYYRAWTATSYIARQDAGSGVFGLNTAALQRIGRLPDVINDDGYVARHFSGSERVVCDATFTSFAARDVRSLVKRRARIVNGNRQLDGLLPDPQAISGGSSVPGQLLAARREGRVSWSAVGVFLVVTAASRLLAAWRRRVGTAGKWSTDATTRGQ